MGEEEAPGAGRTVTEKGLLLSAAITLITLGVGLLEDGDIFTGALLIALGLICLFAREALKFHRWHASYSYWRGRPAE